MRPHYRVWEIERNGKRPTTAEDGEKPKERPHTDDDVRSSNTSTRAKTTSGPPTRGIRGVTNVTKVIKSAVSVEGPRSTHGSLVETAFYRPAVKTLRHLLTATKSVLGRGRKHPITMTPYRSVAESRLGAGVKSMRSKGRPVTPTRRDDGTTRTRALSFRKKTDLSRDAW